jgi:DNA repair exonuclease SbcCD ATPase subunit
MKEIKFKRLNIKNFLSIGDEGVEITFPTGLNIITGVNLDKEDSKNGVGKSTIADAFCYAVFGQPLRDIRVENIPNWKTNRTCELSIEFDLKENFIETSYRVERSLNPSKVYLYENGEDIARTISKTNSKLKKIMGTTPDMFEQSVLMSINQTEPFLQKRPGVKRKFIEGIFKLDIFSEMLAIIRHDVNETKRNLTIEKARIGELQKNLTLYKTQQIESREKRDNRIKELNVRKVEIASEVEDLSQQINDFTVIDCKALIEKISQYKERESSLNDKNTELIKTNSIVQTNILSIKERLTDLDVLGDNACQACNREFTEEDRQHHGEKRRDYNNTITDYESQIKDINIEISEIEKVKKLCKQQVELLTKEKHEFEIQQTEVDNLKQRIISRGEWNEEICKDIERIKDDQDDYSTLISDVVKRLSNLNKKQEEYQQTLDILDISKFAVSEEGVRSFIVKKMLTMLNSRLGYYLQKLDANCICTFDEYFEENIQNLKGKQVSYFNFSDGERKRIDLAMLFTFLDIRRLQSNISINFAMYDELLDSSLDSKGIECVLEILQERIESYNESVFIISHKNEAIKHATGEVIYLEKLNEVTRRISYDTTV